MNNRLEEERNQELQATAQNEAKASSSDVKATVTAVEWNDEEIRLLIKGAKVIPVGTRNR